MMDSSNMNRLYIPSIIFIALIYLSLIVTGFLSLKYLQYNQSHHDFFVIRNPTLNLIYISTTLFILYILIPLILASSHIASFHSYAPLIMTEMTDLLIFLCFFMRTWALCFDRIFVQQLKQWMWRREVNHQDSNFIIKHRQVLKSSVLVISVLYLFVFTPIFATLQMLQFFINTSSNPYIARTVLLSILWCCTYVIVKQIHPVSDKYNVRCELQQSLQTVGTTYMISHIVYLLFLHTLGDDIALFLKLIWFCVANFCILYCACYRSAQQYEFTRKLQIATMIRNSNTKSSFVSLLPRPIHFQQMMNSNHGFLALCNHLQHEMSLESILFVLEATQFKGVIFRKLNGNIENNLPSLCNISAKRRKDIEFNRVFDASTILDVPWLPIDVRMHSSEPYDISLYLYEKYIEESADLCINISYECRKGIYRYFQELHLSHDHAADIRGLFTVFDAAFKDTWRLIATDSYFRFRATDEFMKIVECMYPKDAKQAHENMLKLVERTLARDNDNVKRMELLPSMSPNSPSATTILRLNTSRSETQEAGGSKTITTTPSTNNYSNSIKLLFKNKLSRLIDNFTEIPSESMPSTTQISQVDDHGVDFMSKPEFIIMPLSSTTDEIVSHTGHSTRSRHSNDSVGNSTSQSSKEPHTIQYRLRSGASKKRPVLRKSMSAPNVKIESLLVSMNDDEESYKTTDDMYPTQRVINREFMRKYRQQDDLCMDIV